MNQMEKLRRRARRSEEGATTLEYIVLAAVLVLGLVAGINAFKDDVEESLKNEGGTFKQVSNGVYTKANGHKE